ncbi:hypothetical protein LCGC14_1686580 [marine sediment metagenome]|uniref:DNA (cytosine-5-)-methyltransferase n=1 Tax=marine sediment metagenome TaxID=412755 RepID=A0A0F9HMF7_9ZZZZ
MTKIILDLCGGTGAWSNPYKKAGYDVRVITLPDYDVEKFRISAYQLSFIKLNTRKDRLLYTDFYFKDIYGILAAPPCTEFSFARTNAKNPRNLMNGMDLVNACLKIIWACQYHLKKDTQKKPPLKFWALENPNGMLKFFLGKPAYQFNPYDLGDNYKKNTYLWGWFNEPKKNPIKCTMPKFDKMASKDIHPEQFGKLTRQERRAITPQGFAKAFFKANQ